MLTRRWLSTVWNMGLIPKRGRRMAELKRFECIIEFEPVGAVNGKGEVGFQAKGDRVTRLVRCKECRHRDPEDRKCDCGGMERQGCPFPVDDDYFCAYGEMRE